MDKKKIELYKPVLICFFVVFVVSLFLPLNWADDAVFAKTTANRTLFTFLKGSARPFTDGLTYIFSHNKFLWRILNPFVLALSAYSLSETLPFKLNKKESLFLFIGTAIVTMALVDAGFIATTVNYLWPIAFGLFSLMSVKKTYFNEKNSLIYKIISIPLLVYATNMQQMCAVLLGVFLCFNIYLWFNKRFDLFHLIQLIISASGAFLSLYLNFSGDNSRMLRETNRYFPAFAELNIFEKAELGFSSTFFCFIMETRFAFFPFIAFTIYLAYKVFKKNKSVLQKTISLVSPVTAFVLAALSFFENPVYAFLSGGMVHGRMTKSVYSFNIVPFILFVVIGFFVLYTVLNLIENKEYKFYAFSVLVIGLASRMLMGFSPTVWASGYRTFSILILAFIYVVLIVNKSEKV